MSQLSDVAAVARKVIKYGGAMLVVLIVGRVVLGMATTYWKSIHPDPPPPPDVKFGKLPKLLFPQKEIPTFSYALETRTGSLPVVPDQFRVYFMPIKKPSLLAYDSAKELATRLDFITEPTKLTETDYRWDITEAVDSSLKMNIITGAFILDRKWQQDPAFETPNTLPFSDIQAADQVYNFLSRVDLLADDLQTGTYKTLPLKADSGVLIEAPSTSKAQFMQVDLFRAPVNDTKVVSPNANKGLISAVLAFQREDNRQFVRMEYNYFPVDLEQSASYPLITVSEAWNRMQNGGGYVAAFNEGASEIVVREVYLAYYDADIPQQFLQPVFVFEGDSGFVGYVPAIADDWVE